LESCFHKRQVSFLVVKTAKCKRDINHHNADQGRRYEGTGEKQFPPLLTKVVFVNRLKPMRTYWGYGGVGGVTSGSNLYFIQLLTNFILPVLNLCFCHLKQLCPEPPPNPGSLQTLHSYFTYRCSYDRFRF